MWRFKSLKITTIRKVIAWFVGIAVVFSAAQVMEIYGLNESFAEIAIFILSIMIGARIGMAIYTGKLNGNVSPKRNHLFFLFMIFIIIMGIIGTIAQFIFDEIFSKEYFWQLVFAVPFSLLFMGIGILIMQKLGILNILDL